MQLSAHTSNPSVLHPHVILMCSGTIHLDSSSSTLLEQLLERRKMCPLGMTRPIDPPSPFRS